MTEKSELKQRAMEAFNRTAAHPADPRVRLTDNSDDLVAIHCDGVSAVVWQREQPADVLEALKAFDGRPYFGNTGSKIIGIPVGRKADYIHMDMATFPDVIQTEMASLEKLFRKVSERDYGRLGEVANYQHGIVDPDACYYPLPILPHTDGTVLRLGCVFSEASRMGTQWHPLGTVEVPDRSLRAEEIMEIKNSCGLEQVETGHVVVFKGRGNRIYPVGEHFVHSTSLPVEGVKRMGYFVGYV